MTRTSLIADRDSRQRRQRIALRRSCVHLGRLFERPLFCQAQIHIKPRICLLDPLVIARRQIDRFHASRDDTLAQFGKGFGLFYKRLDGFGFTRQSILP